MSFRVERLVSSTPSYAATVTTAIRSRKEGLATQGYDTFTAHEKDTRKMTAA